MNYKITLLIFLLVSCVEKDIEPLKNNTFATGHFELYKGDRFLCFIERNDSIQMEMTSKGYTVVSISKIVWKNRNNYTLSNIEFANDNTNDLIVNIRDTTYDTAYLNVRYAKPWYEFYIRKEYRLIKRDSILSQRFYDRLKNLKLN
ncbi:hypothetical protein [Dokdonia sp.]